MDSSYPSALERVYSPLYQNDLQVTSVIAEYPQSVHMVFRTFFYDFVQYVTSVSSHEVVFVYLCKRQQDSSEIYRNQQRNGTGQGIA